MKEVIAWIAFWTLALALTGMVAGIVLVIMSFKRNGLMRYAAYAIVTAIVLLFVVLTLSFFK